MGIMEVGNAIGKWLWDFISSYFLTFPHGSGWFEWTIIFISVAGWFFLLTQPKWSKWFWEKSSTWLEGRSFLAWIYNPTEIPILGKFPILGWVLLVGWYVFLWYSEWLFIPVLALAIHQLRWTKIILIITWLNFVVSSAAGRWLLNHLGLEGQTGWVATIAKYAMGLSCLIPILYWQFIGRSKEHKQHTAEVIGEKGPILGYLYLMVEPVIPKFSKRWKCKHCGQKNGTNRVFCKNCATRNPKRSIQCTKCKTENEPGSTACGNCGELLTSVVATGQGITCGNCNVVNPAGSTVCGSCGHALTANTGKPEKAKKPRKAKPEAADTKQTGDVEVPEHIARTVGFGTKPK